MHVCLSPPSIRPTAHGLLSILNKWADQTHQDSNSAQKQISIYWFVRIGECEECKLAYHIDLGELVVNIPAFRASWWLLALNSLPPFSCHGTHSPVSAPIETVVKGPSQPTHSTAPPKIGTFYTPGSRGRLFPIRGQCFVSDGSHIQFCLTQCKYSTDDWKYLRILFFHLALFMACQAQFEICYSAMFIIHKHQINTTIHENYLALNGIADWGVSAVVALLQNFNFPSLDFICF